jgi:hypothetical protein
LQEEAVKTLPAQAELLGAEWVCVGFGDAVTPEARDAAWPGLLDFPPVSLLAFCPETTMAQKLHAAVVPGTAIE